MDQQKEMTEEEMKKASEERKKEWDILVEQLEKNKDQTVTKEELLKVVNFFSEDFGALAQMTMMNSHNIEMINRNFQQFVSMFQQKKGPSSNKTQGGIILP